MNAIWQDVRYAIRSFRRNPTFTVVAVTVLAVGMSLNAAIFAMVNAVLLRPLPVRAPGQIRYVYALSRDGQLTGVSYRDYLILLTRNQAFTDIAACAPDDATLLVDGDNRTVRGEMVSANYFSVLGVTMLLGRSFTMGEEALRGSLPSVVISEELWRVAFNGDHGILGQTVLLDPNTRVGFGHAHTELTSYTIIGVAESQFRGVLSPWQPAAFWVPLSQRSVEYGLDFANFLTSPSAVLVGRVRRGMTDVQVHSVVTAAGEQLEPYSSSGLRPRLIVRNSINSRLPFARTSNVLPSRLAAALMGVGAVVLLIAGINLAGLLGARGVVRRGELALRLALGASRWRVSRQLLTESLLLSAVGGALGLVMSSWLTETFLATMPSQFGGAFTQVSRVSLDVPIDVRVFLFSASVCLAAGVLLGLAPARQAWKTDLVGALAAGTLVTTRPGRSRLRHWIIIPQAAISVALLLVAGVFVRMVLTAETAQRGYNVSDVAFIDYQRSAPAKGGQEALLMRRRATTEFEQRLLARAQALPEVEVASLMTQPPWDNQSVTSVVSRENRTADVRVGWVGVSPGFFDTFHIRLISGRDFEQRDATSGHPVAIVCDRLARLLWPHERPVGKYIAVHHPQSQGQLMWREVIGVVKEVKPVLVETPATPLIYTPLGEGGAYAVSLVARGRASPAQLIRALRTAVRLTETDAGILRSGTAAEAIGAILYPRRLAAAIFALSGFLSLVLASVGVFGVVTYSVAQRVREIGIRTMLGADRRQVVRLLIGEGLTVAMIGSVTGILLAFTATHIASSLVVSIPPIDVLMYVVVPLFLTAVVLIACYIPARAAARVDPMVVLRTF